MTFLDQLQAPLQFDFMINALVISAIIAIPMALLSCFLVLKGWALMGDAISHAVLPGIVIAYIVGFPYAVGAFVAAMLCAFGTGFVQQNSRIKQDTAMGVIFAGMFGLGLVLYTYARPDVHLEHILFGDMLGIAWNDILWAAIISVITGLTIAFKWKDLRLHAFDPAHARAIGLNVALLHFGLLSLISLTLVGALQAVGLILAIAMLIAPGAIALLLSRRFSTMLLLSVAIAVFASLAGVYLSFYIDSAPAPTIVLLLSIMFVLSFIHATRKAARMQLSMSNQ